MDWLIGNTLGNEFVFSLFLEEQDWCTGERTDSLTTNMAWVRVLWLVLFSPLPPPREVFLRVFGFPHLPRNMLLPLLIFFSLSYLIRASLHYLNSLCTDPSPQEKSPILRFFLRGGEERGGGSVRRLLSEHLERAAWEKTTFSNSKSIRNGNERITSYVDMLALNRYLFIHLLLFTLRISEITLKSIILV